MKRVIVVTMLLAGLVTSVIMTAAQGDDQLAPDGQPGDTYLAPFPLTIALDGDLDDWAGVPVVTLPEGLDPAAGGPGVTFAAAADEAFLYLMANVYDDNIISGQHGTDYWNEDSVEFYINATGDLTLTSYQDGVAQITISPLNIGLPPEDHILAGVRSDTVDVQFQVVKTGSGWAVELAAPLENDVWTIQPEHGGVIGFQVHLNAASQTDRDTKLIWSLYDTADQSYQNPGLFGHMVFFEIGQTDIPAAVTAEPTPVPTPSADSEAEWSLVWSDEFDAAAGTPINDEFWTCETGGHGWGNNEWEYYTDRVENVAHDGGGNLAITARQETLDDSFCWYGECTHTSARCTTQDKEEFTYGRIEARMKLPYGQGIWPAFWMLGANFASAGWPGAGEIDIMEHIGREPRTVHGTVHGPGYSGASGIGAGITLNEDIADDFHVFGIEWEPDIIRWYVDGRLYNTIVPAKLGGRQWVFDHDFFLLMNVAVGGYWPGYPDDTTVFPQTMLVDWVRVYQR